MGRLLAFGTFIVLVGIVAGLIFVFGYRAPTGTLPPPPATVSVSDSSLSVRARAAVDLVRRWVDEERVPGAVISVHARGAPVVSEPLGWARAYEYAEGQYPLPDGSSSVQRRGDGLRRLDEQIPMTVSTIFDLASVTKVMATTTAVALLVERGLVGVDETVATYLPDFTGGGRSTITVEHLLTHTSGLPQWLPIYYHAATPDEAWSYLREVPLERAVGAERRYSDLGFMVLARVVEVVSGRDLSAFVSAEVYEPLGLASTGFRPGGRDEGETVEPGAGTDGSLVFAATSHGNPFEYRMVHDPGFGYRIEGVDPSSWSEWRRRTLAGEVNDGNAYHAFRGVAGHAGLFSTASDLQVLLSLWLGGGVVEGTRLLGAEVVRRFTAPVLPGQALGWQLPDDGAVRAFAHSGFTGTYVYGDPDTGLGLVLLTNRQNAGIDESTSYTDVAPLQRDVVRLLTGRVPGG